MALDDVLAGLGGALDGGLANYSWQKDYQQKDRKITEDADVRRLQQEIKFMLETMKEGGRNERYAETSGNVVAQQAGATDRTGLVQAGQTTRATDRNDVTMRGQDINESLGLTRNDTTRRGQDLGFELGGMRDETTRRGQDFGFTLGTNAETGRNDRAGDANALREAEAEKNRALEREKMKKDGAGSTDAFDRAVAAANAATASTAGAPASAKPGIMDWLTGRGAKTAPTGSPPLTQELVNGTGRPTAEPIEVMDPPSTDAPQPRSPEAADDEIERLTTQATSLLEQFRREADPAKKEALRRQLLRVRDQRNRALGKGQ